MYFIHSILGSTALVLAFIHQHYLFSMDPLIKLTGHWAWYLTLFGFFYACFFLSGFLVNHFALMDRLKKSLQPVFRHQFSMWVHRLNLIVIALIWLHVHLIGRITQYSSFMILFDTYTAVILLSYIWWQLNKQNLAGTVVSNFLLSKTTRQLSIQLAQTLDHVPAGAYFFLSVKQKHFIMTEPHPYSITFAPEQPTNLLTFTIKMLGDDTRELTAVAAGDHVRLSGPFGLFDTIVNQRPHAPLILIGLGTGIAPLLSLAEQYHDQREIHVLWTTKSLEEQYYKSRLDKMVNDHFRYDLQAGRFKYAQLDQLIKSDERKDGQFIIVGSPLAMRSIQKQLRQLGISRAQMHNEQFVL